MWLDSKSWLDSGVFLWMKLGLTQSFLKSQCVVSIWASSLRLLLPAGQGRPFSKRLQLNQFSWLQLKSSNFWIEMGHIANMKWKTPNWSTSLMWSWECFPTQIQKYGVVYANHIAPSKFGMSWELQAFPGQSSAKGQSVWVKDCRYKWKSLDVGLPFQLEYF